MKFSIFRFDPEKDEQSYMQDYDIQLEAADRMLLDALYGSALMNQKR